MNVIVKEDTFVLLKVEARYGVVRDCCGKKSRCMYVRIMNYDSLATERISRIVSVSESKIDLIVGGDVGSIITFSLGIFGQISY